MAHRVDNLAELNFARLSTTSGMRRQRRDPLHGTRRRSFRQTTPSGWHTTDKLKLPRNVSLIFLPSRAPELNPVENVWQILRANWLSNTVFDGIEHIIDAACSAWNNLAALPDTIRSIGLRKWAHTGQCQ